MMLRMRPPPAIGASAGGTKKIKGGRRNTYDAGKRVKKAFGNEKEKDDEGVELDPFDTRPRNKRTGGLRQ